MNAARAALIVVAASAALPAVADGTMTVGYAAACGQTKCADGAIFGPGRESADVFR
jgi:hypothetical protein